MIAGLAIILRFGVNSGFTVTVIIFEVEVGGLAQVALEIMAQ